ncbi:MAG: restriction endonuclease subunit [Phycisphaerales bacterium]|nr:restriction endonuclease subunit [Phycisphaerales bacterium]
MALCDALAAQQQERDTRHAALSRAALARFADAPTRANLELLVHSSFAIPPAQLRNSIITLAVRGKLVAQDATDDSAEALLREIAVEKRKGVEGEIAVSPSPVEEDERPFPLPPSWKWARLGDIASIKHGFAFSSENFTSEAAPFVLTTPGNFHEKGGFRYRGPKTKYYRGAVDPDFIFKPGDLIIPMTEQAAGLLGSPAFIPDDGTTYIHNQRLGKLNFFSDFTLPGFFFWFFNCTFFRNELSRTCTGMKVRHTSPKRILNVPVPMCSLAEQRRIVAKVDELTALVDQLEAQLAAARAKGEKLLEAAVAQCVMGFDPAQPSEPASPAATPDARKADGFLPGMSAHYRESDLVRRRARVAAFLVHEFKTDSHFHRTKLEKLNHLLEYHCGVELRRKPIRDERGPNDFRALLEAERFAAGAAQGWFTVHDNPDGYGYDYRPGPRLAAAANEQRRAFGDKLPDVQRLVNLLRDKPTKECEIIATLYAAWNDLLLAGQRPGDDAIVREARENWHPSKKKIPLTSWRAGLDWMRTNQIIPRGTGRPVIPR